METKPQSLLRFDLTGILLAIRPAMFMDVMLSDVKATRTADSDPSRVKTDLVVPAKPVGVVILTPVEPGSLGEPGSAEIARAFQRNRLATLTFNSLEETGQRNGEWIATAARQLTGLVGWTSGHEQTRGLPIGFFGAYAGAAASLTAAAELGHRIHGVVACSGKLEGPRLGLSKIKSPTLLIVGGRDLPLIQSNQRAARSLRCANNVALVPRASHFFEEPGALPAVLRMASEWFFKSFHGSKIF